MAFFKTMFWLTFLALSVSVLAIAELCGWVVDQLKSAMKAVASSIGSVRMPKVYLSGGMQRSDD